MTASQTNGKSFRITHPQRIYFDRIDRRLQKGMSWLDVGCGRKLVYSWLPDAEELESELLARPARLVGIDLDLAALRDNVSFRDLLMAGAEALPFRDGSFDLVTSNMVFEHVERPAPALAEIRRVMCRGGRLIIFTPNAWDIVSIVARAVPNRLHPLIVSRLEGRAAKDVYPTQFKFNRSGEIRRIFDQTGFRLVSLEYLEHHNIFGHRPVIAQIEDLWHRVARRVPAIRGTLLIEAEAD
ncbi:MAG TPA: class I SAM-dependent methyltransferase [Blastocatellia bacterium]|nr:class I SAM-dependent methyltransferase [Blastocatellia bacterium]